MDVLTYSGNHYDPILFKNEGLGTNVVFFCRFIIRELRIVKVIVESRNSGDMLQKTREIGVFS